MFDGIWELLSFIWHKNHNVPFVIKKLYFLELFQIHKIEQDIYGEFHIHTTSSARHIPHEKPTLVTTDKSTLIHITQSA